MAFPVYHKTDTVRQNSVANGTTVEEVDYPANVSAGDLLLLVGTSDNANRAYVSGPSGYTTLFDVETNGPFFVAAKIADGTETGTTSFTIESSNREYALLHMRFSGTSGDVADIGLSSVLESASSPVATQSATASGGSADNLFISFLGATNSTNPTVTFPSSLFQTDTDEYLDNNFGYSAVAMQESTSATYGTTDQWAATGTFNGLITATIVIPPAAGGTNVTVSTTGEAATGAVGDVTVTGDANVSLTGESATGNTGTVTVSGDANTAVTGEEATGAVGDVTVVAGGNVSVAVTGEEATGAVGDVTVDAGATNVPVTGEEATGAVGTVTVTGDANVSLTGIAATGAVGTITVDLPAGVPVTGTFATSAVGTVAVVIDQTVELTGLSAEALAGKVNVWGPITPDQSPGWGGITPGQTPNWSQILP